MQTYIPPKPIEDYPEFQSDRQRALSSLDTSLIDHPLISLINKLNTLPYLFTLQCCFGHFLSDENKEISEFDKFLPSTKVTYRLAYIAFCIENSPSGKNFVTQINDTLPVVGPELVQFCSAHWFWDQWINSYALQVMPERFKDQDIAVIDFHEIVTIQQARDLVFEHLKILLEDSL